MHMSDDVLDHPGSPAGRGRPGKISAPSCIDVARRAHVGRRQRVAAIRLMGLGQHREAMGAAIVEDRHQDRVVGGVRVAVVGRIMQEGVARLDVGVELHHRPGHQVGAAQHVDRVAVGGGQQIAVGGHERAGEVARRVDHARARRAQQRVRHLAGHALEALLHDRELDPVDLERCTVHGDQPPCPAWSLDERFDDQLGRPAQGAAARVDDDRGEAAIR